MSKLRLISGAFVSVLFVCNLQLSGQLANGGTASSALQANSSDPARAAIEKSITSMGGEAWASVGAASTQVTTTYPSENAKPVYRKQSDDWSRDGLSRRDEVVIASTDPNKPTSQGAVIVAQGGARLRKSVSGKLSITSRGYDLSDLAVAYPAVALRFALQRKECSADIVTVDSSGTTIIRQTCIAKGIPGNQVHFIWSIDKSGLPIQVEFPNLSGDGKNVLYTTAVFREFQHVQALTVPTAVDIRLGNTVLHTMTFAAPTFSANLPDSLFSLR